MSGTSLSRTTHASSQLPPRMSGLDEGEVWKPAQAKVGQASPAGRSPFRASSERHFQESDQAVAVLARLAAQNMRRGDHDARKT